MGVWVRTELEEVSHNLDIPAIGCVMERCFTDGIWGQNIGVGPVEGPQLQEGLTFGIGIGPMP